MAVVTGIMIIMLAVIHVVYGEIIQIRDLKQLLTDPLIIGSMRIMIYQGGILLLGVGIVQFLKGMGRIKLVGTASYFPVGIIGLNILTFVTISLISRNGLLRVGLPQLVAFLIIIIVMVLESGRSATEKS